MAWANFPAGVTGTSAGLVTLTTSGGNVTLSNGIVSITCPTDSGNITAIGYTYNNGSGTTTTQMLNGGDGGLGGKWYPEYGGFGGGTLTYSAAVNPSSNGGKYGEIAFLSTSSTNGTVDIHFSMLQGSPGFYATMAWTHRTAAMATAQGGNSAGDLAFGIGETRSNIYAGSIFNWMTVDPGRNKLMAVSSTNTSIVVPGAPVECYLWTSGPYNGRYDDKYKYAADFSDQQFNATGGPHRVWGWTSVGTGGLNVGMWLINASQEYYNGGPMKRELMEHIGTTMLNMTNGDHFNENIDGNFAQAEYWNKVYGPTFVYCNNVSNTNGDPYQASLAMYTDAQAQGVAEVSGTPSASGTYVGATTWPYGWFNYDTPSTPPFGVYTPASGRGTVTGQIVVSDTGNPNASGSNMFVGLIQQPLTSSALYDFQTWTKPYQFWTQADGNGNFTIPNVVSGTGYTLYAFGQGAESEFMSQNQSGGNPPVLYNLPSTPFSVTVTAGTTTSLGTVTWTPTRLGATVFEIGYPDRTARKFRHGDDFWVGDIGPSISAPSPVWTKFLEYPFDFPNGVTYTVGSNRWTTDWNFIQPVEPSSTGIYNSTSSNIDFTLPTAPTGSQTASLYLALCSNFGDAAIITVNGTNLGGLSGVTATPNSFPSSGYYSPYNQCDASIREGNNGTFSDERVTFPATLLKGGTNINVINISFRQTGNTSGEGYFANHIMYDYFRLELSGYVPPAPAGVTAYSGSSSVLVSWPVTPGATSYNIGRSTTSGAGYSTIATGVHGPVCGSGYNNDTWLDTTATNGTTYYYVVQSANTTGTSANSAQSTGVAPVSTSGTAVPSAPTLSATAGSGEVSLGWTASSGANYYVVQRSTLYNNGAVLAGGTLASGTEAYNTLSTITLTNTATGATYMDATPTNGSTYSYTVSAVNASGTGAASAAVTAQPEPAAPTTAPVVTATPGIQSATLSWGAVPGAEGYVIEMATSAGGPYTLVASVTELTYVVTGLDNNTTYYFEVFATNTGGSTSDSTAVSTTTPLGAPTGFSAAAGNTQVTLTWAPVSGATSYSIVESTATNGTFTNIGDSIGPSYTATALTNGTTYYFAVAAIDANGTGPDSTLASATPTANVPLAPTGLTATPGNAEVTLNWNASAGATSYDVQQAATTGGPYTVLNAAVTGTTYTSTGLSNGATYYYVVAATGTGGTGADSDQVSATPSGTGINLTWTGTSSTAWDTVTSNWLNGTSPTTYTDGDGVIFQDTALTGTVAISGTVSPASVSFNNSILNYIIDGAPIAGATGVIKTGSATLTFNNVNNYTGGTAVNAGTLALGVTSGTGGTAGSGVLTLAQGTTFAMNSPGNNFPGIPIQLSDGASATLYSANAANQYGGPISGAASSTLTFSGGVSLAVSGSEQFANYDGLVYIPSGSSIRFASTGGANGNGGSITSFEVDGTLYTRNSAQAGGVVLGSLAGSGTVSGQNANPAGTDTYFIGSNNADTTFSGSIVNGGSNYITAVTKVGDGTLILAGTCSYTGATIVEDGILEITGSVVGTTSLTIEDDGEVYLAGGTLSVAGNVTNEGIFKESGTNTISVTGTFENDGVLDLIDAPSTLPPNFVNDGTVLFASDSVVSGVSLSGSAFSVSVQSYTEHNYQLQRATSLSNPVWTNVGSAQAGTGSTLEFMDPSTTGSSAFYRILVSP